MFGPMMKLKIFHEGDALQYEQLSPIPQNNLAKDSSNISEASSRIRSKSARISHSPVKRVNAILGKSLISKVKFQRHVHVHIYITVIVVLVAISRWPMLSGQR